MEIDLSSRRKFAQRHLPWITGCAALALYLFTLQPWVSFLNMAQVARLTGFSWEVEAFNPTYFLFSLPLRLLPVPWIPLAANVWNALCAAVIIGLLTRAVAILPHDRTHQQREREMGDSPTLGVSLCWVPPLFAAMLFGLQLTFWQHATNATLDLVNLLLFAYVARNFLEYRLNADEAWLMKASLAYGALMTSDWMAAAGFPLYIGALIWLRGLSFFKSRFISRMLVCGVIGLSLYFLLPVLATLSRTDPSGFWITLKSNLGVQKNMLFLANRKVLLLMSLTSVVPAILVSIKWASYFGDTSRVGVAMANLVFNFVHALMLLSCVWVMFDPPFSPRHMGVAPPFVGYPFLQLYLLTAVSAGYFCGYLLVVFRPILARTKRTIKGSKPVSLIAATGVVLLAIATPILLVLVNFPTLSAGNRPLLRDYARLTAESLPAKCFLLADDPRRALVTQLWLTQAGRMQDYVLVETWPLATPIYARYLKRQYGDRLPFKESELAAKPNEQINPLNILRRLEQAGELYYLHPSFGIFFEYFYPEPHGLVYRLHSFKEDELLPPPLSEAVVAENEAFWQKASDSVLPGLSRILRPPEPGTKLTLRRRVMKQLRIPEDPPDNVRNTGSMYSRQLDCWGVEERGHGNPAKANEFYQKALEVFPENVVAQANLEFYAKLRAGEHPKIIMPNSVEDRFGERFRSWDQVLGFNGPYDESSLCYSQGFVFMQRGLVRQAAVAFERALHHAPDDLPTRLWLAQINLVAHHPERTLELTREINENPERFEISVTNRMDAFALSARAHFARQDLNSAVALLEGAARAHPTNSYLLANITAIYSENGLRFPTLFSNAYVNVGRQLQLSPDEPAALLNKGFLEIQLNRFPEAIQTLTYLLTLKTNDPNALLDRAIAYLRNDELAGAEQDYQTLLKQYPTARQVAYGLNEVAFRRKDTNACINYCQLYLSNSVPGAAETQFVEKRLQSLRAPNGTPPK